VSPVQASTRNFIQKWSYGVFLFFLQKSCTQISFHRVVSEKPNGLQGIFPFFHLFLVLAFFKLHCKILPLRNFAEKLMQGAATQLFFYRFGVKTVSVL